MSRKQAKTQASSSRIVPSGTFGGGFGSSTGAFGSSTSRLSYLAEQPDTSSLNEPSLTVIFRNLAKKDSTTKSKALEELQSYLAVQAEQGVETDENLLYAWTRAYPRSSIDNERRVRQLSHTVQGIIFSASGKKAARYMPDIVGSWITGCYEADRSVSKAATDAFVKVFATEDKQENVYKVFQTAILKFCEDVLLRESVRSLSDERSTKAEDAEAKYYRVVASSLAVLSVLLQKLTEDDVQKQVSIWEEVFASPIVWSLTESQDSAVRRSVIRLIQTCLTKRPELIEDSLPRIFTALLSKKSVKAQSGSALEYSNVLVSLVTVRPELWQKSEKRTSSSSLLFADLAKHGSQGASAGYWQNLARLFQSVPKDGLPDDAEQASKVLIAIKSGISRKDEPRSNADDAWSCYSAVLQHMLEALPSEQQDRLLSDMALIIIRQYLHPEPANSTWSVNTRQPSQVVGDLFKLPRMPEVAAPLYSELADRLVEKMRTSAPEQAKDFDASQLSVIDAGRRWFELQKHVIESVSPPAWRQAFDTANLRIISEAFVNLKARNGKPYGAAGAVNAGMKLVPHLLSSTQEISQSLENFLVEDAPSMMLSPSRPHVIAIMYAYSTADTLERSFASMLRAILDVPDSLDKQAALTALLTFPLIPASVLTTASENTNLQAYFTRLIGHAMSGQQQWTDVAPYFATNPPVLSSSNVETTLEDLIFSLTVQDKAQDAMAGLEMISRENIDSARYLNDKRAALTQNLLLLLESADEATSARASALNARLSAPSTAPASGSSANNAAATNTILTGLTQISQQSLEVGTLVDFARDASKRGDNVDVKMLIELLPPVSIWEAALMPIMEEPIPKALTKSALVSLLEDPPAEPNRSLHDKDGYSAALRIAMFHLELLEDHPLLREMDAQQASDVYRILMLCARFADDSVMLGESSSICQISVHITQAEDEIVRFTERTNRLLASIRSDMANDPVESYGSEGSPSFVSSAHRRLLEGSRGFARQSFHNGRAFSAAVRDFTEKYSVSQKSMNKLEAEFQRLRKGSDFFETIAFIGGFKDTLCTNPAYAKTCNELVAAITGADIHVKRVEGLQQIILLNHLLQEDTEIVDSIAKQRLIFFVKHVIPWLESSEVGIDVKLEICHLLDIFLPAMSDVYGEHWTQILDFIRESCLRNPPEERQLRRSYDIPFTGAVIRLFGTLRSLQGDEDINEDLTEAVQELLQPISTSLVALLKRLSVLSDAVNQPLRDLSTALGRQVAGLPLDDIEQVEDLYPLVTSGSPPIQLTAFNLLHERIPALQEQVSIDTALDKTTARLPDELMSLILDPLTLNDLADASFEREMPSLARGYLSSWLLIFDHFRNASDRVSQDYTEHIKEGSYLSSFLDFMTDFLGHSRGKPVDASKFDVTIYSFDVQDDPLKDMQWLLIHLYFLSLKRLPTLVKAWYMDLKSRQTVQNIESWTEKYISPAIITDSLNTVQKWADTQDASADDALLIKTNHKTREITLAKELDAQLLALAIQLPPKYPLGLATCNSVNRVAVDPKKWQTWLRNTQGVIAFSNNSLIEGIIAFRRNVNGALRGQSECAICYSIVGADKQLPTKKCGTCRNTFHGSCLYRWFKSSNSSSCPLCRNAFNYT